MFRFFLILFFGSSALAQDLKILKIDPINHFVVVKPSPGLDDTDLRKYEILLDLGEEVCNLKTKKTTDYEWEFFTDGCDDEKPVSRNSRIYLQTKPSAPKVAPVAKSLKRDSLAYNFSLFYDTASTYRVFGTYESTLVTGNIDTKGKMSGGAPGFTMGVTIPGLSIFEVDAGFGYEFARKIKSESGSIGGTSYFQNYGGRNPTLKIFFLYGNLRFYMPLPNLYLFAGYVYGLPSISEEVSTNMSVMSGLQGGAGYKLTNFISAEVGLRTLSAAYKQSGTTSGGGTYSENVSSFNLTGIIASLKYEL